MAMMTTMATEEKKMDLQAFKAKKDGVAQVRLPVEVLGWIDDLAQQRKSTRSAIILEAISNYIQLGGVPQINIDAIVKAMTAYVKIVPDDNGEMRMELIEPGVIRLDGEEANNKEG